MKKLTSVLLVLVLSILLIISFFKKDTIWENIDKVTSIVSNNSTIFELSELLTETNTSWSTKPRNFFHFHDKGFTDVSLIPPAYQGYVGYDLNLSITTNQNEYLLAYYKNNGREYLIISLLAKNPLMIVAKANVGSVKNAYELFENGDVIPVTIISATNISIEEFDVLRNATNITDNSHNYNYNIDNGYLFADIGKWVDDVLLSVSSDNKPEKLDFNCLADSLNLTNKDVSNLVEIYSNIFERFKIEDFYKD